MSLGQQIESILSNNWVTLGYATLITLLLAILGTIFGLIIGIFVGQLRAMKIEEHDHLAIKILKKIGSFLSWAYVTFFRGTPMMVQAMILFNVFPIWTNISANGDPGRIFNGYVICALIIISINTGAYMTEIVKSGMNGVDNGQTEAARSLGLSKSQTLWGITLPQAIKNCLPTIGNEYIVNVKDSSVLNVIGLRELYGAISTITTRNYYIVAGYAILAVIYLVLTSLAALGLKLLENKLTMPNKVNWLGIRRSTIDNIVNFFKKLTTKKQDEIPQYDTQDVLDAPGRTPLVSLDLLTIQEGESTHGE